MASIFPEYQKLADRWYDRWGKAMAAARVGQYPPQSFASDVADCWIDGTYAALLPLVGLGLINVTFNPAIPTFFFVVTAAKNDQTQFASVQVPANTTGVAAQDLTDVALTKKIPSGNISAVLTPNGLLVVSLQNLGTVPAAATADFYAGPVVATPSNVPVAQVQVVWPG